ncbi:MAG: host-nuclease inhibitor protein Gam [Methanolinea sp. SDB]|nr:MAG: host-nuclease inhibitor protein Gam [Methanolinea sp. SDB]
MPQSRDEANEYIGDIGRFQRERERLRADMNDEMAVVKERYEAAALPLGEKIKRLSAGVQTWCEAHRAELTQGGKVKHAVMAAGKVNWRMRPPRVSLRGKDNIIASFKALGLTRFIRTIEDINKEAVLAEPEIARQVAGVSITQSEDFVITPHETELEEVA